MNVDLDAIERQFVGSEHYYAVHALIQRLRAAESERDYWDRMYNVRLRKSAQDQARIIQLERMLAEYLEADLNPYGPTSLREIREKVREALRAALAYPGSQ